MKTINKITPYLLLVLILMTVGCASVTRGTTDVLEITSTPANAQVTVVRTDTTWSSKELKSNGLEKEYVGAMTGVTPATFTLARKGQYRVEISKPGYKISIVPITNKISGAGSAGMAGNVLLGGFIGAGIDAGTGAMKDLVPNPVMVTLEQE